MQEAWLHKIQLDVAATRGLAGISLADLLAWAAHNCATFCPDKTFSVNSTLPSSPVLAYKTLTINTGVTVTCARPITIILADTVDLQGTLSASGLGCAASVNGQSRFVLSMASDSLINSSGLFGLTAGVYSHANSVGRTGGFTGSGAGGGASDTSQTGTQDGGGATYDGGPSGTIGNPGSNGVACDLTVDDFKTMLFAPCAHPYLVGTGASGGRGEGGTYSGGQGGGSLLILARQITLGATGFLLANGVDGSDATANDMGGQGGGGGGCIACIGDTITDSGATLQANGGLPGLVSGYTGGFPGGTGGNGFTAKIEV